MNGKELNTKDVNYVSGYQVIQVNVTDGSESLYAVVTPIKKQ